MTATKVRQQEDGTFEVTLQSGSGQSTYSLTRSEFETFKDQMSRADDGAVILEEGSDPL